MFYIIKKGTSNFWHRFNNDSKEVNISKWEVVLDNVNQTVSLQMPNGSNIPANEVGILEVIVIDETGANVNETFSNVLSLRVRLVTLGYNPYDSSGGGGGATTFLGLTDVPNNYSGQAGKIVKVKATEDGLEFDNPIVNLPTLQEVLDNNADLVDGNFIAGTRNIGVAPIGVNNFIVGENTGIDHVGNGNIIIGQGAGFGYPGYVTNNINALGNSAAGGNMGSNINAFGANAAENQAGNDVNALGNNAAAFNTGNDVNIFGNQQDNYNNEYNSVNLFGRNAEAIEENQTVFSKFVDSVTQFMARISYNGITESRNYNLPDKDITFAGIEDIPAPITIDATPTNGSPNAVSSDGTFDALAAKAPIASPTFTGTATTPAIIVSSGTALTIASFDASKNVKSLPLSTYPSLPEIANVKGVNAPIQPQLDLRKKQIYSTGASVTHTGSTSETTLLRITIPAGTLTTTDLLNINRIMIYRSLGGTSTTIIKFKLSTSTTMPSGTTDQIASYLHLNNQRAIGLQRGLWQESGLINFLKETINTFTDINAINTDFNSRAFDNTSTTYYLYITATLGTSTDDVFLRAVDITN